MQLFSNVLSHVQENLRAGSGSKEGARSVGGFVPVPMVQTRVRNPVPRPSRNFLLVASAIVRPMWKIGATLPHSLPSCGIKLLTLRRPRNLGEVPLQQMACQSTADWRVGGSLQRCRRPKQQVQRHLCFRVPHVAAVPWPARPMGRRRGRPCRADVSLWRLEVPSSVPEQSLVRTSRSC